MKRALLGALMVSAAVVGVSAGSGSANGVPRHDHFLVLDSGAEIQVGPRVCENSNLHTAFHNFHDHVHTGTPTAQGGLTVIRSAFCEPAD